MKSLFRKMLSPVSYILAKRLAATNAALAQAYESNRALSNQLAISTAAMSEAENTIKELMTSMAKMRIEIDDLHKLGESMSSTNTKH